MALVKSTRVDPQHDGKRLASCCTSQVLPAPGSPVIKMGRAWPPSTAARNRSSALRRLETAIAESPRSRSLVSDLGPGSWSIVDHRSLLAPTVTISPALAYALLRYGAREFHGCMDVCMVILMHLGASLDAPNSNNHR
jgi:hypothetical protein